MTSSKRAVSVLVWSAMLVVATVVLRATRGDTDQAHVVLAYLLVVLGGSVSGGRALGLTLAAAALLLINFFFQLPYDLLAVNKALDWVILVSFMVTAIVATQLLALVRAESVERERLAAEAEHVAALREAARMKDVLLASVSHDLRTPLTTIKALAQKAALGGDENARVIEEQAERLSRLVGDLLDLSRFQGGGFPVAPELNMAEDVVGAAIRQVAGVLNGRRVVPRVDTTGPALAGRFDFVQTLRILTNLLGNALRYAPPDSAVELGVERAGAQPIFTVRDRGPGIASADRERIFEPFYRTEPSSPGDGRTGLGLSIARRLAELQSGTLDFTPRPGGGSTFILRLPATDILAESLHSPGVS